MSLTRRRFIETASLSLLASAALPAALALKSPALVDENFSTERQFAFHGASPQTFQSMVGESFAISANGRPLGSLTLLSVSTAAATDAFTSGHLPMTAQPSTTSFSLRFHGAEAKLEQGTYTLRNARLGAFPLFIVPSGPGAASPTYTAVFNLLSTT
jgi:hypothetical protein